MTIFLQCTTLIYTLDYIDTILSGSFRKGNVPYKNAFQDFKYKSMKIWKIHDSNFSLLSGILSRLPIQNMLLITTYIDKQLCHSLVLFIQFFNIAVPLGVIDKYSCMTQLPPKPNDQTDLFKFYDCLVISSDFISSF